MSSLGLCGAAPLNQGAGEPVVLLHSSGGSGAQWRSLTERLLPHRHVVAPDLYGYGVTPAWAGRGVFSLAHEAALVETVLDDLGEPVHLVGHSYGGAVALHMALANPHRLRSLSLIEPVAFHLLRHGDAADWAALQEILAVARHVTAAVAAGDLAAGCERFVDYWTGPGAWAALPAPKRDALAPRLSKVALDFQATLNAAARIEDVPAIGVPTLLLQGGRTATPTRRICRLLAEALPDARLHVIAGAGHMLPLTHRDEVHGLVIAHLDVNSDPERRGTCRPCQPTAAASATPSASRTPSASVGTSTAM